MLDSGPLLVAEVQQVLDKGFQQCLALGKKMQDSIEEKFSGKTELLENREELKGFLSPWFNSFYELMAHTIFEVLRMLQPEDFKGAQGVNFYLLPGYHSHLIGRRIFFRAKFPDSSGAKTYGVGLCGDPVATPDRLERYHDCCHSRWYRYATMPTRPERDFLPASPYHWFAYQQPRVSEDPYDLVASLTFSTIRAVSETPGFPQHKVLNLADHMDDSQRWGSMLADMLNGMPYLLNPKWEFPDRGDRATTPQELDKERRLRPARCLLISLWMHSVFKCEQPDWWDTLHGELASQQLNRMTEAIGRARGDGVACDWGDKSLGRPEFRTWTTISLLPLVAPPPPSLLGSREHALQTHEASDIYRQTIGWATLLCSAPLELPFISVVRQWIRTVYGMLRSVEVSVLLRNREPLERAAQAVRAIPHDLHRTINEAVTALLKRNPPSDDEKRFILLALQAHSTMGYAICSAAADPDKAKRLKDQILKSLSIDDESLRNAFHRVASDIQRYETEENRAHVIVSKDAAANTPVPQATYASCLLLIGEMIRNYCEHGPRGDMSELKISRDERRLNLVLEGKSGNRPGGDTFALLHNVLEILKLGEAKPERIQANLYRWRVSVNLSPEE